MNTNLSTKELRHSENLFKQSLYINSLESIVFIKDLQSRYINISKGFSELMGFSTPSSAYQKTDYELPCKASESASNFIAIDQRVVQSSEKVITIETNNYKQGWESYYVEKTPIRDQSGSIIALNGIATKMTNLNQISMFGTLDCADRKKTNHFSNGNTYIVENTNDLSKLSTRQLECLFFILRGKTMKEIAYILDISTRTVENHIIALKGKLGCTNKSQLIEHAICEGYLHRVPKSILQYLKSC